MEMQDNANRAALAVFSNRDDVRMRDEGWKGHRLLLVPLLPQEVLLHMSVTYGACWIIDDWISRLSAKPKEAKEQVEQWIENVMLDSTFLIQLTKRWRFVQMIDLLLDRPTFRRGGKSNEGTREQFRDMRKRIMDSAGEERASSAKIQKEQGT
jgi:hypothetical protein